MLQGVTKWMWEIMEKSQCKSNLPSLIQPPRYSYPISSPLWQPEPKIDIIISWSQHNGYLEMENEGELKKLNDELGCVPGVKRGFALSLLKEMARLFRSLESLYPSVLYTVGLPLLIKQLWGDGTRPQEQEGTSNWKSFSCRKSEQRCSPCLRLLNALSSQPGATWDSAELRSLVFTKVWVYPETWVLFPRSLEHWKQSIVLPQDTQTHLFLTTAVRKALRTVNIIPKVAILKTHHEQIPLAPPLKTSVFHADAGSTRREEGPHCENACHSFESRSSYVEETDALGGKFRINGRYNGWCLLPQNSKKAYVPESKLFISWIHLISDQIKIIKSEKWRVEGCTTLRMFSGDIITWKSQFNDWKQFSPSKYILQVLKSQINLQDDCSSNMRNSRNNASLALVTKIKNKNRKYNLRWQGNGFPSGHYHRGGDMRAGGQGCSTGCPLRTAKGLRVQAWLLLWLRPPVVTGVKATELLIFPKIFSKQQQPQQFSCKANKIWLLLIQQRFCNCH